VKGNQHARVEHLTLTLVIETRKTVLKNDEAYVLRQNLEGNEKCASSRPVQWELLLIDSSRVFSPHLHFQIVQCTTSRLFPVLECQISMMMQADDLEKTMQSKNSRTKKNGVKLYLHHIPTMLITSKQDNSLPLVLASFISFLIFSRTLTVLLHLFRVVSSSNCWSSTDWKMWWL
jgi:hypothetical protein